jgi:5-amino-6-(5-phospho-D-ribitylamino)uracil phosphatase
MPELLPDHTSNFSPEKLRPFSEIQLIAIDIDGTLLESNQSELSNKFLKLLAKLKHYKYGPVRVTIATGRTLAGARPLLDKMSILKDTPIILYNGSLILDGNYSILRKEEIASESLRKVVEISSGHNVQVLAYSCDWIGENGPNEYAFGWSSRERPQLEYNKMPVTWLDWGQTELQAPVSAVVIHTKGQTAVLNDICSRLSQIKKISYSQGGTSYIEVRADSINKGVALEFVAAKLKLKRNQVLSIGDNDNDAEMLSWAGIGVAVESASNLALEKSDYKTTGVVEGAIKVLSIVREARHLRTN